MNWLSVVPVLSAAFLTIAGWWAVSLLSERRDKKNKARELRSEYLISVCRTLTRIGLEKNCTPFAKELENAVADIYLFGSSEQVRLVKVYVEEMSRTNGGNMDALLKSLRTDLRKELQLSTLDEPPQLLRIQLLPSKPAEDSMKVPVNVAKKA